jgi:hypothetical protein
MRFRRDSADRRQPQSRARPRRRPRTGKPPSRPSSRAQDKRPAGVNRLAARDQRKTRVESRLRVGGAGDKQSAAMQGDFLHRTGLFGEILWMSCARAAAWVYLIPNHADEVCVWLI